MQLDALPICDASFLRSQSDPCKSRYEHDGKEVGSLRAPLTELEEPHKELLKKAMTEFGLL